MNTAHHSSRILLCLLVGTVVIQAAPTYTKDVAPILFANCATCHRPGQVAPFSLLTYEDAAKHAKMLADVTAARYMPPWKPDESVGHFANERRLTKAEIETISQWASAGAPEGNPKDLPPVPQFSSGWSAGEPDVALSAPPTMFPPVVPISSAVSCFLTKATQSAS